MQDEIIYIHIKDAVSATGQNVVCGTGQGRIPEILALAIDNGYKGFLTLEPHLVLFESLKDLELEESLHFIENNKALTGADAYKLQYEALLEILKKITSREEV